MDGHLRTCNLCGITTDGVVIRRFQNLPTSAEALRDAVLRFPRPVTVVLEESTLAQWFYDTLRPIAAKVVVVDPRHNYLISRSTTKSDPLDAQRLAELFRLGAVRVVYHADDPHRVVFRRAVQQYEDITRESTKFKNRIRKTCNLYGCNPAAADIYHPKRREAVLADLPADGQYRLRVWYRLLDGLTDARKEALRRVKSLARAFPEVAWLRTVPGLGALTSCQFSAYIQSPDRFHSKSQVYSYARLAVVDKSSAGKPLGRRHLSHEGIGVLKAATRRVFDTALRKNSGKNAIAHYYRAALTRLGNPVHARLTTQRRILSAVWTMWKKKEVFHPDRFLNHQRV
jgi:transposase